MSEDCKNECSSCGETCGERREEFDFSAKLNDMSRVGRVIGVVSGKGGVGKSLVTSMMATLMRRQGFQTAILDADITGPSIPRAFGLKEKATQDGSGIYPVQTKTGISVMSINLLLENETDPVVWRGPMVADVVKQFWSDVVWDEIDYMFVDMPPGTGDVPLTVFQSLPVDGIIVVASPQELVGMIVEKAVNMAAIMEVPVIGLVENMSYFQCPDCGKKHYIFGESHIDEIAQKHGIRTVCKLPVNPQFAAAADNGTIELMEENELEKLIDELIKVNSDVMRIAVTYEEGQVFQHFGHTEKFKIYDVENGKVTYSVVVDTEGSGHGALAGFLNELQVDALICGGIGGGARMALEEAGIEIYPGAAGDADAVVEALIAGSLDFDPDTICSHHEGHENGQCGSHSCGEHSCHDHN